MTWIIKNKPKIEFIENHFYKMKKLSDSFFGLKNSILKFRFKFYDQWANSDVYSFEYHDGIIYNFYAKNILFNHWLKNYSFEIVNF